MVFRFFIRNCVYLWVLEFKRNVGNLERSQSIGIKIIIKNEIYEEIRIILFEKEKSEWQFNNGFLDIRNYYIEVDDQIFFMCKYNKRNRVLVLVRIQYRIKRKNKRCFNFI